MDLNHPAHPYEPIEHEVIIRPHALRRFCRAVRTDSWGEQVHEVCAKLGTTPGTLIAARWAGVFTERYVKGLGGKRGKPIPLIHSWTTLDPSSARYFSRPDQLWGALWEYLPDRIPDDFEQTIIRHPIFGRSIRARPSPTGELDRDDMQFKGWRWICPGCNKRVRTIYYPFAAQNLLEAMGGDPAQSDLDRIHEPPPTFACGKCHQLCYDTRTTPWTWNLVISHVSGALLYGREVQKPQWYRPQRKNARCRKLGRIATKRQAIFLRLMNGWTLQQIARDLLISMKAVIAAIQIICRQEQVKNRRQLAAKLGWKHEQPLNGQERIRAIAKEHEEQVFPLILDGLSWQEIAHRTGLTPSTVHKALLRIYKKHGLSKGEGKRALAKKFGLNLTRYGRGLDERGRKRTPATENAIPGAQELPIPSTPSSTSSAWII